MRYRLLGKTGLRVAELCLGVMGFGGDNWGTDITESKKILHAYLDAGGNFFDTAYCYNNGASEEMLGELMKELKREDMVIETKFGLGNMGAQFSRLQNCGNSRKVIMQSFDTSLKRLKMDYIDVYVVHAWDFTTPIEEVLRALDDAVRAGKILYIGASNTPAWAIARANAIAESNGWTSFSNVQLTYNLCDRSVENEFIPMCRELDIAITCAQPLAGGALTNIESEMDIRFSSRMASPLSARTQAVKAAVKKVADEMGCSSAAIALSWLRQQKGVVIPIAGARLEQHILDNLAALDVNISDEHMAVLNEASKTELVHPYDVISAMKPYLLSADSAKLDNHHHPEVKESVFGRVPWAGGK